jgi:uncharacterized OsmC-like protein
MTSSNKNIRQVRLRWSGEDLLFHGGADGGPQIAVDGGSKEGPAPMQLLLLAVAGCMGIDIKMILEKSRVPSNDSRSRPSGSGPKRRRAAT